MKHITIEQIASLVAFLVALIGGIEFLLQRLKKALSKPSMDLLRIQILQIYYEYKDSKKIPIFMKQAVDLCFDTYRGLGGNSFIESVKNEIDTWEVIG